MRRIGILLGALLLFLSLPAQAQSIWQQAVPIAFDQVVHDTLLGRPNQITDYSPGNLSLPTPDRIYTFVVLQATYVEITINSGDSTSILLLNDSSATTLRGRAAAPSNVRRLGIGPGRHYLVAESVDTTVDFVLKLKKVPQGEPVYFSGEDTIRCGLSKTGSISAGPMDSVHFYSQPIAPEFTSSDRFSAFGKVKSYTMILLDSQYIYIQDYSVNQRFTYFISGDSSNSSIVAMAPRNAPPQKTGPGKYWLYVVSEDTSDAYTLLVTCSHEFPFKNIATFAEDLPSDGHVYGNSSAFPEIGYYFWYKGRIYLSRRKAAVYKAMLPNTGESIPIYQKNNNGTHGIEFYDSEGGYEKARFNRFDSPLGVTVAGSTGYFVVEQASNSFFDPWDAFDLTLSNVCAPEVDNNPTFFLTNFKINGRGDALYPLPPQSGYRFYTSLPDYPLNLYIGTNNAIDRSSSRDTYCNMYIDFNRDGDFDDPSETIYIQNRAQRWVKHNILLPETNPVYFGALGKSLVMRIITSATPITRGPCDSLGAAHVVDMFVKFTDNFPPPKAVDFQWVRIASDDNDDRFVRVRNVADSSVYVAGCHTSNTDSSNLRLPASRYYFQQEGLPGQGSSFRGGTYQYIQRQGIVSKYGRDGSLLWTTHFQASGTFPLSPGKVDVTGLSIDPAGNVYAAGTFTNSLRILQPGGEVDSLTSAGGTDGFIAKFHPDGRLVYAFRYGGPGEDASTSIEADSTGVFLSGSFSQTMNLAGLTGPSATLTSRGSTDAFLAAFSDSGAFRWAIQGGGPGRDIGTGVALNRQGSRYLAGEYRDSLRFTSTIVADSGFSLRSRGGADGFVLAISDSGQIHWAKSFGGPGDEIVRDVAADPRGTGIVVVGGFRQTSTFDDSTLTSRGLADAYALRLSDSGSVDWVSQGGGSRDDIAYGVRLDHAGNLWVALTFQGSVPSLFGSAGMQALGGNDGALIRLDASTGQSQNAELIATIPGYSDDQALGIDTADGSGALVAGYTSGSNFGRLGYFRNMHYILPNAFIARYSAPLLTSCLLPTPTLTTNSPVCQGDSLLLTATNVPPYAYAHLTGPGGYSLMADSGQIPAIPLSAAGTYTLTVTSRVQLCARSDSSLVVVNPKPVQPLAISDTICGTGRGLLATLNHPPADTVHWYDSSGSNLLYTGPSFTTPIVESSTTYQVAYQSLEGCRSDTQSVFVKVNPLPEVHLDPIGVTHFCAYDSVTLYAYGAYGATGLLYQFFRNGTPLTNATGTSLVIHDSSRYSVLITDVRGCSAMSDTLRLRVDPVPPAPTITVQQQAFGILLTSSSPIGNHWFRNGNLLPRATDSTILVVNVNGTYSCVVSWGDCYSPSSPGVLVIVTDLNKMLGGNGLSMLLTPNPTNGHALLTLSGIRETDEVQLRVTDVLGRTVWMESSTSSETLVSYPIDLSSLPKGIYTLHTVTTSGTVSRRLEIE